MWWNWDLLENMQWETLSLCGKTFSPNHFFQFYIFLPRRLVAGLQHGINKNILLPAPFLISMGFHIIHPIVNEPAPIQN